MAGLKSFLWKMYLFKFLDNFVFINGIWVPFYMEWGKISYFQIMVLEAMFFLSVFFMAAPSGALADFIGRKKTLLLSVILFSASTAIFALKADFFVFAIANLFWAAGFSLASGSELALLFEGIKASKEKVSSKKIIAKYRSAEMFALMASAPIGSILAAKFGLRAVMFLSALPVLLALIPAMGLKDTASNKKREPYFAMLLHGLKYFWEHRILRILAFDNVSLTVIMFFSIWVYAPVLLDRGLPLAWLGLASAAIVGARAIFLQYLSRIEKLFSSKKTYLLISAVVPSLCFLALPFANSVWAGLILLIIIAGMGMTRPSLFDHYNNIFIPSRLRATVLSSIAMIAVLGIAVFSPIVGLLAEKSMDTALFSLGGAGLLFSLLSRVKEEHLID